MIESIRVTMETPTTTMAAVMHVILKMDTLVKEMNLFPRVYAKTFVVMARLYLVLMSVMMGTRTMGMDALTRVWKRLGGIARMEMQLQLIIVMRLVEMVI